MSFLHVPPLAGGRPRPSLALLVALTATGTLAMHIFVPALPAAALDLKVTPGRIQLAITLYLVGLAVGQLFYGPLSDRFGRRPMLLGGLLLFTASGLLAAFAAGVNQLILARVCQALGGCGGLVLGRAMARDGTTPDLAAAQLGLLNLVMSLAPGAAPAIGGYVTALFGWRAIFLVLAAFGAINLVLAGLTLPETNRHRLALPGLVSMIASYARLLRSRSFCGYALGGACTTTSFYAFVSAAPFLFVDVLHRPAQEIGIYFFLLIGGLALGSFAASRLAGRLSIRNATRIASIMAVLGAAIFLGFALADRLSVAAVVAPMALFMLGVGIASPFSIAGAISADPMAIGAASALYGFIQMAYGALCTLIVGAWHTSSAVPVTLVLLASALIGQLAFALGTRT